MELWREVALRCGAFRRRYGPPLKIVGIGDTCWLETFAWGGRLDRSVNAVGVGGANDNTDMLFKPKDAGMYSELSVG